MHLRAAIRRGEYAIFLPAPLVRREADMVTGHLTRPTWVAHNKPGSASQRDVRHPSERSVC